MAKKRFEVCREEAAAQGRAVWMEARGYSVDGPAAVEKAIWSALDVTGQTDIASDDDGEVWLVIGTK